MPERNCDGRRRVSPHCRKTLHIHYSRAAPERHRDSSRGHCYSGQGRNTIRVNSYLPAETTSYKAPPRPSTLLSLSEDEIEESVCSLQNAGVAELASAFYSQLDN